MADEPDEECAPERDVAEPSAPARDYIAENLRALFRNADLEPLPEDIRALLERLAREEGEGA